MASDSMSVVGWTANGVATPKLWRVGPFLMGGSGELRAQQIVRYELEAHIRADPTARWEGLSEATVEEYLVRSLVPTLRTILSMRNRLKNDAGLEFSDNHFLIAWRSRLFTIWGDFGVEAVPDGYGAVGSARDIALGALAITADMPPKGRLRLVMETAHKHNMGVRPPFDFDVTRP